MPCALAINAQITLGGGWLKAVWIADIVSGYFYCNFPALLKVIYDRSLIIKQSNIFLANKAILIGNLTREIDSNRNGKRTKLY